MRHHEQMKLWEKRREKMLALQEKGWTLREIAEADDKGITPERVRQLIELAKKKRNGTSND